MAVSLTHQIIFYYHSYYHLMTRSVSEQPSREALPADALSGALRKKLKGTKKQIKETHKMKKAEIKAAKYNHVEN